MVKRGKGKEGEESIREVEELEGECVRGEEWDQEGRGGEDKYWNGEEKRMNWEGEGD